MNSRFTNSGWRSTWSYGTAAETRGTATAGQRFWIASKALF
ncbi:hypothetical protein ANCCAN_26702 [Ancylostoma caninum]|uniref:Uncharacterized protein n=1 Tax=Ancylostoma caninum TaxID=29170 RepID=A0A368F657_ANCCA|nr:hypothetical protein ANCCAN_26702 [Ancylostoma caninum]